MSSTSSTDRTRETPSTSIEYRVPITISITLLMSTELQITNRFFRYASPHLWNQLPSSFRQPDCVHSPPGSPHPTHITSSQSSPSFSPSVTPSTFHSRIKTYLFHKSFPPLSLIPSGLTSRILTCTV